MENKQTDRSCNHIYCNEPANKDFLCRNCRNVCQNTAPGIYSSQLSCTQNLLRWALWSAGACRCGSGCQSGWVSRRCHCKRKSF